LNNAAINRIAPANLREPLCTDARVLPLDGGGITK
jgi:hypothetical protein